MEENKPGHEGLLILVNLLVDESTLRTSAVVGGSERAEAPGQGGRCGVELLQSADLWSVLFRTRGRH